MLILPRVYASIKILVFLSGQPNYQATTTVISKALGSPLPACRKTAWQLKLAGVLTSGRGPRGIRLARAPNEIWVGQLVRSLEQQRTPLGCEHELERTLFFAEATERFFEVLDSCTVMDICLGKERDPIPRAGG